MRTKSTVVPECPNRAQVHRPYTFSRYAVEPGSTGFDFGLYEEQTSNKDLGSDISKRIRNGSTTMVNLKVFLTEKSALLTTGYSEDGGEWIPAQGHTGKTERKLVPKVLRPLAYCLPTLAYCLPPELFPAAFTTASQLLRGDKIATSRGTLLAALRQSIKHTSKRRTLSLAKLALRDALIAKY